MINSIMFLLICKLKHRIIKWMAAFSGKRKIHKEIIRVGVIVKIGVIQIQWTQPKDY